VGGAVDYFEDPFRFQPEGNTENHIREHAINIIGTTAEPNNEAAVPKGNAEGYKPS
jgi:hypothetical protein